MGLMPPFGFGNPMTMLLCHSAATGLDTFPPVQKFTQASAVSSPSSVCSKSIHKPSRQPHGPGSAPSQRPLMHRARVRLWILVCGANFACCLASWKACWVTCGSGDSGAITSQVAWTVARVSGSLGPSLSGSCAALLRQPFLALRAAASCVRRLVISRVSSLLGVFQSSVRVSRSFNASCRKSVHMPCSPFWILTRGCFRRWIPSARLGFGAVSRSVSPWSSIRLVKRAGIAHKSWCSRSAFVSSESFIALSEMS